MPVRRALTRGNHDCQRCAPGARRRDGVHFSRHGIALAVLVAAAGASDLANLNLPMSARFAAFGALHAAAFGIALDGHHPLRKKFVFMAASAALSAVTCFVGMAATRLLQSVSPTRRVTLSVLLCSALGSCMYAMLIRRCWLPGLSAGQITAAALLCALATYAAFYMLTVWPAATGLRTIAVLVCIWWTAFSMSLWLVTRREPAGPN